MFCSLPSAACHGYNSLLLFISLLNAAIVLRCSGFFYPTFRKCPSGDRTVQSLSCPQLDYGCTSTFFFLNRGLPELRVLHLFMNLHILTEFIQVIHVLTENLFIFEDFSRQKKYQEEDIASQECQLEGSSSIKRNALFSFWFPWHKHAHMCAHLCVPTHTVSLCNLPDIKLARTSLLLISPLQELSS